MSTVGGPRLSTIPSFINTYSLDFDGMDDYVSAPQIFLNSASVFSMSFWAKKVLASDDLLIGDKISTYQGMWVNWYTDGNVYFTCRTGGNITLVAALPFDTNWHHFLCTKNGTDGKIFVDGVLSAITPTDGTVASILPATCGDNFRIGSLNASTFGKSIIDEVSLWDSVIAIGDVWDGSGAATDLNLLSTPPLHWYRNGDNGSWKSPQWLIPNNENKDKVSNYSFSFDGMDDRVQLSSDFVASGEFTLSFWMKPVAVTGNGNIFPIGTFPDNQNHVRLDQIGVIYLKVQAVLCLFNEGVVGGGANNLVLDVWQHMTFIRDSSNVITCYRNGSTFGGTATNSGTLTLNSFGRVIANTFGFGGGLDGIAFWNSDQTSNLATIYNSGTPTTLPSGAVAHYKMGEDATFSGGVWTVPDSVGSNDGTSVNMTIEDRVGNAPNSTSNAVSLNMDEVDRATDVPT